MSLTERFGVRDLTYSGWHRPASISRFVPLRIAERLTYIDLDGVEYCATCREPLCLLELAQDRGQTFKPTSVLQRLAAIADVPAALVFYLVAGTDIERFRVELLHPKRRALGVMTPAAYAEWLVALRDGHTCRGRGA